VSAVEQPAVSPRGYRRLGARTAADTSVVLLLGLVAAMGFEPTFGGAGYLLPAIGGLLVGAAVALTCAVLRLPVWATALLVVAAYYVFGSPFAVPGSSLLGFVPTLTSLSELTVGAVLGWADLMTLTTPVGVPPYVAVVPYLASLIAGLVSVTLATRWLGAGNRSSARAAVVLAPVALLYLLGTVTGTHETFLAELRGVLFAVVALVWVGWARIPADPASSGASRSLVSRKLKGTAILIAGSVVVGAVIGAVAGPAEQQRFVLRDQVVPPFDPAVYPSPLSAFRSFSKLHAEDVLFTVDGLSEGEVIRLATMDSFTGKLWNVAGSEVATSGSGTFRLVSGELPPPSLLESDDSESVTITIEDYTGVWMPSVGYPTRIVVDGAAEAADRLRVNTDTGTAVLTRGLESGDSYTVEAALQTVFSAEDLDNAVPSGIVLPATANVPDIVLAAGSGFVSEASAETPYQKVMALTRGLADGYLVRGLDSDPVLSSAGHGADRLHRMFENDYLFGDEEQYSSALALMVRELGYPARVVIGFRPDTSVGGEVEVVGADVTAWVEVAFDDYGWVAFDPTPEKTDVPQDQVPQPRSQPQPQTVQPPQDDEEDDKLLTDVTIDDTPPPPTPESIPGWVYTLVGAVTIPVALLLIPLLVIAALKARRARRRRSTGAADRQAAGAWDELVDIFTELGYSAPRRATRLQLAANFEQQFHDQLAARAREQEKAAAANAGRVQAELPGIPGLHEIAVASDEAVFSGRPLAATEVDALWGQSAVAVRAARASVSWIRRQVSRFRIRPRKDLVEALLPPELVTAPRALGGVFTR
jgi:hypothetical protein